MLQAFVRMCDIVLQRNMRKKELFLLFYFPDSQFCSFVDIMLIKQRQFQICDFRLHLLKNNFIRAGIYDLFAEYLMP